MLIICIVQFHCQQQIHLGPHLALLLAFHLALRLAFHLALRLTFRLTLQGVE